MIAMSRWARRRLRIERRWYWAAAPMAAAVIMAVEVLRRWG